MIKEILDWILDRRWLRREQTIYDIRTPEFQELAEKASGLKWDFSVLGDGSYRCCVKGCGRGILWGHWTCEKHVYDEKAHFRAVDEYGNTFWSHRW